MLEDELRERERDFRDEEKRELERDNAEVQEKIYDSKKYISGARRVSNGTVPMNILQFHHSFSYDCQRYFNLCVVEPNVVIFASGNILHFLNTATNELWFRRGYTGGGIGHVTKNPMFDHIAVGENGIKPPIIIYKWPSMDIVRILHNGTMKSYCHLVYSADGMLLMSQGGSPDYTFILWDWQKSEITLKCKSYNRDVYNVTISPLLSGYLVTSGSGHIKFWKISETFTGLKLKGEIGRFGQTEISDIIGVYIMPDGKVVSGCEWGNILLWEEGLITLEVCRKNRQPCHAKAITQFEYMQGELISVGMDGWIRIWFYETIDQAYPHNGERFLEIQPIYEYHISESDGANDSMLMCICKQEPDNPESTFWYAQDGNGGIWLIDLHTLTAELPRKIFTCHAGAVADMDKATWGPFVATLSKAGQLHIYNYLKKKLILVHKFNDIGSQIVWFPCQIEATGSTLACAFGSGIIRVITVAVAVANATDNVKGDYVRLIQVIKPHKMAITAMSLNPSCSLLVTGSEDSTVFNFTVTVTENFPVVTPIGFIKVPSGVTCLTWKPQSEATLLIGCSQGDCVEVILPSTPQQYTIVSYELVQCRPKTFKFHSVKSAIRRELIRLQREKEKKEEIAQKRKEIERLMAESPGLEISEEAFFYLEEEPLPEIYIPKIPNKILIAQYISSDIIWLSMAGFDAGYMYEYPSPDITEVVVKEPVKSTVIHDADDIEIRSCLFYRERKYLFLGMEHGQIRICRWKSENYTDLSDYWILPMHDNYNGYIPKMLLSHDQRMLFTCGYDGNLFSYDINDDAPLEEIEFEKTKGTLSLPYVNIEDIEEIDYASLEEMIQQAEYNKIATAAKQSKQQTSEILLKLSEEYSKIVERNNALPKPYQITFKELELDPRITADLYKELDAEMAAVRAKLAFKVEKSELGLQKLLKHFVQPITFLPFVVCKISEPDSVVYSIRQRVLDIDITLPHIDTTKHTDVSERKANGHGITDDDEVQHYEEEQREEDKAETEEEIEIAETEPIADFLKGINFEDTDNSLIIQLNQILRKYTLRKRRLEEREKEWKGIYNEKPDISINHTHDVFAIEEAKKTIGDYKLKTSSAFNLLSEERDTLFSKYKELLNCRKKLYYQQEAFNTRLKDVRTEKELLHAEVLNLIKSLKNIHAEIPLQSIKPLPVVFALNINVEFPERKIMMKQYIFKEERRTTRRTTILPQPTLHCPDKEYEVLLLDDKFSENARISREPFALFSVVEKKIKIQSTIQDNIKLLHLSDDTESPWEREMKSSRMLRKIYEQDCILRYIQTNYDNLDKKLDKLERDRLDIVAENINLNLFLLTLRQEYVILKDYEIMENVLHDQVNRKLEEVAVMRQKIQTATEKIDIKSKEITKLQNQIKDISSDYMRRVNNNKFRNFLCRIFRKKYKEVKEEDETVTTTETDTDETDSVDNGEFELMYLDESVCPPGCDETLYNLAFSMREKRYACEHEIRDEQRIIETLYRENQIQMKKLKIIESNLKKNEDDLKMFMLKKQQKLNDVEVTVLMKLHQLQYFEESQIPSKVRDCVVFDKKKLSKLYARIQELHEETLELHAKHKHARVHLQKIKLDCKHMRVNNKSLQNEIKLQIMNKFGQHISLNKLYETILRRIVYDIKANLSETTIYFTKRIKHIKENYAEELVIFNKLIQEHTQKLSFLTVLVEEQSKLQKLSKQRIMSDEEMLQLEEKYKGDIIKLESILENQMRQKCLFRNDIKNLKLKTKSQPVQFKEIISSDKGTP